MAFIRCYDDSDYDEVRKTYVLFYGRRYVTDEANTLDFYLFCGKYLKQFKETCFVLDDGNGICVGYIVATPDTAAFVSTNDDPYRREVLDIFKASLGKYNTDAERNEVRNAVTAYLSDQGKILFGNYRQLLQRWSGHFHITIREEYRRQGYGRLLVKVASKALENLGCRGWHLCMNMEDENSMRLYQRIGFVPVQVDVEDEESGICVKETMFGRYCYMAKAITDDRTKKDSLKGTGRCWISRLVFVCGNGRRKCAGVLPTARI